jgi:hypothetical protein
MTMDPEDSIRRMSSQQINRALDNIATAYHEAGHVVVAYEFGWWVSHDGVRIGELAHASLQQHDSDYTVLARVSVSMAGLLAEQIFHGVEEDLAEDVVRHVRAVWAREDEGGWACLHPSDMRAIALALIDNDPSISLDGVPRVVTHYQNVTNALLDEPRVWGGVERVAKALIRRRYLSPRAVKQVLGDAFFAALQTGEGARRIEKITEAACARFMTKRKTIKLDDGRIADAVEELRDALLAANAPIFINRNKLCWRFPDGAVFPMTMPRLRAEVDQYVQFIKTKKVVNAPSDVLSMFLSVAETYRWFPDLPEDG